MYVLQIPLYPRLLPTGVVDLDFLAWLAGIVSQASQSAAAHLALRSIADTLTADIQRQFNLLNIIVRSQHLSQLACLLACISLQC